MAFAEEKELHFVEAARGGGHRWWRYLVGFAVVISIYVVGAGIATMFIASAIGGRGEEVGIFLSQGDLSALGPVSEFAALMLGNVFFLVGVLVAVTLIHRRHPRTLVTARERVSWRRISHGFVAMFVPWSLILVLGQYLLYPETFFFTTDLATFALFVPVALVLIAIQTTTEELFCRGYLVQATSLIWANRVFLALVPAMIFALLHLGNPEAEAGGWITMVLFYFLGPGLVWTVVSLVDGTTELAIGAHFAFNAVYFVVINPAGSVVTTPALFTVGEYHSTFYALSAVLVIPVFLVLSYVAFKREPRRIGSRNSENGRTDTTASTTIGANQSIHRPNK